MEESVEKSCWSVTLWAVVFVVGLGLAGSLFTSGGSKNIVASTSQIVN